MDMRFAARGKVILSQPEVGVAKHAVKAVAPTFMAGLIEENRDFNRAAVTGEAQTLMAGFMERGGREREAELKMSGLLPNE